MTTNDAPSPGRKSVARRAASGSARAGFWLFRLTWKLTLVLGFIAFGIFIGGFLKFANTVSVAEARSDVPPAEAIVVLTGGSARISMALDLLEQGKGRRLLISGVNPSTSQTALEKVNPTHQRLFECCVDLGRDAKDTIGNARETLQWIEENSYSSIILVTSAYHMPRSMVEFQRVLEDVAVTPYAVPLEELTRDGWWRNGETLRFVMAEYLKFLGAKARGIVPGEILQTLRANTLGG